MNTKKKTSVEVIYNIFFVNHDPYVEFFLFFKNKNLPASSDAIKTRNLVVVGSAGCYFAKN